MAVMENERAAEPRFDLSGGDLALDFVNTVGGMREISPNEHLHAYADLVSFARQTGALGAETAARLEREARRRPAEADALLTEAKTLREALYRLFLATVRAEAPRAEDVATLNRTLGRALAHRRVLASEGKWRMGWGDATALDAPLWPIADAAAGLLVSADLARVRVCGLYDEHECSWMFVDRTKARTRRWCSMKECGNRAKARRHYARCKCKPEGDSGSCA